MAFETLPEQLPGDVELMRGVGASDAELLTYMNEKYPTWNPTAQVTETPAAETTTETVAETTTETAATTTETTETTTTETTDQVIFPSIDFSEFGVMDKDELKAKLDEFRKLKELENNFIAFEKIKNELEVPFANDTIAKINGVVKTLGISDVNIAAEIASIKTESLKDADPIRTIALAQVVNSPDILSVMSMKEIQQAVAEKFNIDLDDRPETYPPALKLELAQAIKNVSEKVASIPVKGAESFSILYNQRQEQEAKAAANLTKVQTFWNGIAEKAVSTLSNYTVDIDGTKVSVAVSPDLKASIKQEISTGFLNLPADKANETVQKYIEQRVQSAHFGDIMKAYRSGIEGKIKEELTAQAHNAGQVVRTDKPKDATKESEYMAAVKAKLGPLG